MDRRTRMEIQAAGAMMVGWVLGAIVGTGVLIVLALWG